MQFGQRSNNKNSGGNNKGNKIKRMKTNLFVLALLLAPLIQSWLPVCAWRIVHLGADNNDAIETLAAHFKTRKAHLLLTCIPTFGDRRII